METTPFLTIPPGSVFYFFACRSNTCNSDSTFLYSIPTPFFTPPGAGNLQHKIGPVMFKGNFPDHQTIEIYEQCSPDGENLFPKKSHQMFFNNNKINAMTAFLPN